MSLDGGQVDVRFNSQKLPESLSVVVHSAGDDSVHQDVLLRFEGANDFADGTV